MTTDCQFTHSQLGYCLRYVGSMANPGFIAADIVRGLGLANPKQIIEELVDPANKWTYRQFRAEHGLAEIAWLRDQAIIVMEPGLHDLVLGSNKPKARTFVRWILQDLLPKLRGHVLYQLRFDKISVEHALADTKYQCNRVERILAEQDSRLVHLESTVAEQDSRLAEQDSRLADLESECTNFEFLLESADREICDIRSELTRAEISKARAERERDHVRHQLAETQAALTLAETQAALMLAETQATLQNSYVIVALDRIEPDRIVNARALRCRTSKINKAVAKILAGCPDGQELARVNDIPNAIALHSRIVRSLKQDPLPGVVIVRGNQLLLDINLAGHIGIVARLNQMAAEV